METKYCQMCGMPIKEADGLYGTEADGSVNSDYCKYCYNKGEFTFKGTMEEMIELCIPNMVKANPGMTEDAWDIRQHKAGAWSECKITIYSKR